ncbi:hypothetical protein JZ751_012743 [Albula glossodonta]|uniref:Uncharacterized protein n=1 Tax=Albula glossodonta TaxID=121402 RepID=A0A8T2N017_9TELE|nr:hypothetical protein JZ751_012743 [Albula glossodonta]
MLTDTVLREGGGKGGGRGARICWEEFRRHPSAAEFLCELTVRHLARCFTSDMDAPRGRMPYRECRRTERFKWKKPPFPPRWSSVCINCVPSHVTGPLLLPLPARACSPGERKARCPS